MEKMTNREFLMAVVAGEISEEIQAFASEQIEKLNAKNAKRSSKMTPTQIENEQIKAKIAEFLQENGAQTSTEIGAGLEISTSKASALCRQMVENGTVSVEIVKIPKVGKRQQFSVVSE